MKIVFMSSGTIKSSLSYRPLSLAKELYKIGHDVYIFAPRFDKYSDFKDEKITKIEGVTIVRPFQMKVFSFELGLISYIISSIYLLMKLNPDIIHMFKPNPITLPALVLKVTKKTPIILDTDDLDTEVMKIEENNALRVTLVALSERLSAKYAQAITVGSRYLKRLYEEKYKTKIIAHIPNGADFLHTDKIKTSKVFHNKVVFVGAMNRINILEPLFYAVKNLKEQKISMQTVIIGDGKYLDYFKKITKKLGINGSVTFLGWIAQNKLDQHIKVGDIGYSYMPDEPTIRACSSMKVFQYMQFGAVPLVSKVGDLPLSIFNGKAGYIAQPNSVTSLTQTIRLALASKKTRESKIKYAIQHAPKEYQWTHLAKKIEAVYKKII